MSDGDPKKAETPSADAPKAAPPKVSKNGSGPGSKKPKKPKASTKAAPPKADDVRDSKAVLIAMSKYPTGADGRTVAAETSLEIGRCYKLMAQMCQGSTKQPALVRVVNGRYQLTPAGMKAGLHDMHEK